MKKISLADLLVRLKQYKGLIGVWNARFQHCTPDVESEEQYVARVDYSWKECLEEVAKLQAYIIYLKALRNDASQAAIKDSYAIAELKGFISTLSLVRLKRSYTTYDKSSNRVEVNKWLPVSQKEVDEIVQESQEKINALQSAITAHNNQTFVEVKDYESFA